MQPKEFWMASLPDKTNQSVPYTESYDSGDSVRHGVTLKTKLLYLSHFQVV